MLRLLLASDVHDDTSAIEALRAWLSSHDLLGKLDAVLCPGDLTTAPATSLDAEEEARYEAAAQRVLDGLGSLAPRLVFSPGNHDPPRFFSGFGGGNSSASTSNAHARSLSLAPGLWLAGWGGSATATEEGVPVWPGWPLSEDENAAGYAQLQRALRGGGSAGASFDGPGPGDSLLLLPHCGPAGAGTTVVTAADPNNPSSPGMRRAPILSGSHHLSALLDSRLLQRQCVAVVHGHTHAGVGLSSLGRVPVINPGSLRFGRRFGLLTLRREPDQWQLESLHFHALDGVSPSHGSSAPTAASLALSPPVADAAAACGEWRPWLLAGGALCLAAPLALSRLASLLAWLSAGATGYSGVRAGNHVFYDPGGSETERRSGERPLVYSPSRA